MKRRSYWAIFKANKRALVSFWIFIIIFVISTFANFIANERPIFVYKDNQAFFPIFVKYPETAFGGVLKTQPNYRGEFMQEKLKDSFVIWPPVPYSYDTITLNLDSPPPTGLSSKHLLGTDDRARDVLARLIYGFQISIYFGLILTFFSIILSVILGALQGFYGGKVDLFGQRLTEIWSGVPTLFLLIVLSSFVIPSFWWILLIVLLFNWMGLSNLVRAEFLKARNYDYVKIAKTLGASHVKIMFAHILPNAMVATITYMPFIMIASIGTLISLDFLNFGMPPGSPSLGDLIQQGKDNLNSPNLAITGFFAVAVLLGCFVFIGEGIRDCFDVSKKGRAVK
ncbi:MAG: ABC transporter permease [Helicobacter sp.]|nr:ABC transporter permease [Helicobacter sp.]